MLQLLRGEDLEPVSRRVGRDRGHAAGLARGLSERRRGGAGDQPTDTKQIELGRLKAKLGEVMLERELLAEKVAALESGRPLGRRGRTMSRQVSPVTDKPYGAGVTRVWGSPGPPSIGIGDPVPSTPPRRPGPVGPMADADLLEAIRAVLAASPFHGEGPARCGPGCAMPAPAPPNAASCG